MTASPLDRWSVVLVDDLADLRNVLRLILEHGGPFKVVGEGGNGDEAVALAADLHPDLLVMDVEMPGGATGWEALPRIKEVAPETAVVILSGSRADPAAPPGGGVAAAVLEKGLPPDQLNAALVRVLAGDGAAAPAPAPAPTAPAEPAGPAGAVGVDRFASKAGHDLAQPLQVAYGYLEMLRSDFGAGLDPTAAAWLDAALGSLERMRSFVHALAAYGRAAASPLDPADVDLAAAVDAALAEVDERPDVRIDRGELPLVRSSTKQVVQVLTELLRNAVAHAASVVRVEAEDGGNGGWVVTVADDGPGVPEALRPRVLEPFERSATSPGPGLGLAIAGRLADRLGGRVWLDPERPSAFRFSLPAPLT